MRRIGFVGLIRQFTEDDRSAIGSPGPQVRTDRRSEPKNLAGRREGEFEPRIPAIPIGMFVRGLRII
jgi:hypothetical protein